MFIRQTVQLQGVTLELEGEPGKEEMTIAAVINDPHGEFTEAVIKAAMNHDAALVYTSDGRYTEYLTYILSTRKAYSGTAMPQAVQTEVTAAINQIMADVTVSYYPAITLCVGSSLKFYIGPDAQPRSTKNFKAATVTSLSSSEASLAA